jgi:opacity protein-like surface antigen
MRRIHGSTFAAAAVLLAIGAGVAQAQDAVRSVAGGGISAPGWKGAIDASAARRGQTLADAKLAADGDALHVTTGPAVTYWKPSDTASGDYTVSATFTEPKYMNLNNHPHPYGIVIGGHDMGTDHARYLYCAAYGNGKFIVRGFGPEPFQLNGRRGETNAAVHKAAAKGEPVTQQIAVSVKGDKVECAINGTVVASYAKADVVGDGKLASTDGVYGIRFAHNTEGIVTGLTMTKQ